MSTKNNSRGVRKVRVDSDRDGQRVEVEVHAEAARLQAAHLDVLVGRTPHQVELVVLAVAHGLGPARAELPDEPDGQGRDQHADGGEGKPLAQHRAESADGSVSCVVSWVDV